MSPGQAFSSNCQLCSEQNAYNFQYLFELFWLYFVGVCELVRQAFQHRLYPRRFVTDKNSGINTRSKDEAQDRLERVTIITGATSGIGREIQRELARRGERLIILSHPGETGTFPEHQEILVDFSCRSSTENAAERVRGLLSRTLPYKSVLLFHCAGVYNPDVCHGESQAPAIFQTFAVNTVMPILFVKALGDLISGIVYIGSSSQKVAPYPQLYSCPFCIAKSPHAAYPLSKMLTFAFFESWSQITRRPVIIIHPGVVATQLYRNVRGFLGIFLRYFLRLGALRADESAQRVLQILDDALFFESMSKPIRLEADGDLSAIFWDATTMRPAMIPRQISDRELREWIYVYIGIVAAGQVYS